MRARAWLFGWICLLPGVQVALGQTLSADEIITRVMQHDATRRAALTQYASERTYQMDYKGPIGDRHATMRVRMDFTAPDRKRFTVISESGSPIFCHKILRKLMEGEQEGALEANHLRSMLSPANYNLKLVGEDTLNSVPAWVLEVSPKQENQFNYKGRVWVSKADFAMVRIVGSPAKNPTWLMGSSKFDYKYAQRGEFWLPASNETQSHLRFGGEILLKVDYGDYEIVSARGPAGVISAANAGAKLADVARLAVPLRQ